jgi:hypothetical protein
VLARRAIWNPRPIIARRSRNPGGRSTIWGGRQLTSIGGRGARFRGGAMSTRCRGRRAGRRHNPWPDRHSAKPLHPAALLSVRKTDRTRRPPRTSSPRISPTRRQCVPDRRANAASRPCPAQGSQALGRGHSRQSDHSSAANGSGYLAIGRPPRSLLPLALPGLLAPTL